MGGSKRGWKGIDGRMRKEGGREGRREGEREGGRERGKEGGRKGGKEWEGVKEDGKGSMEGGGTVLCVIMENE